jgi:hypothetical protein
MPLNVRIPNGEVVTVIVPPGAEPGAYIRTPLDSAAPALTSTLGERLANGAAAEEEEVSWVDASLQAEASLRWCVSTSALLLPVILPDAASCCGGAGRIGGSEGGCWSGC